MEDIKRKEMMTESDNEVLSIYLREINRIPLISHEEEYELAVRAKKGDRIARDRLLRANHFISYAVWWIRQSIMKAISEKGRTVRLPLNRSNELMQIQKAQKAIMHDKETSDPSVEDIAEATGLDSQLVSDLLSISGEVVSFDSPVRKGEESDSTFGDFIEDESKGPEEEVVDGSMKAAVRNLLTVLSDKEKRIIEMRFGLDGEKPMSLKEIGEVYGLTKERIRQIEKRALERLRAASEEKDLGVFSQAC